MAVASQAAAQPLDDYVKAGIIVGRIPRLTVHLANRTNVLSLPKAIRGFVFDLFVVLPRPTIEIGLAAILEFSSNDRSRKLEACQLSRSKNIFEGPVEPAR
jgi:hypothetical protein